MICPSVYNITPVGRYVKGGEAVHIPLTSWSGGVTRAYDPRSRQPSAHGLGSSPAAARSISW